MTEGNDHSNTLSMFWTTRTQLGTPGWTLEEESRGSTSRWLSLMLILDTTTNCHTLRHFPSVLVTIATFDTVAIPAARLMLYLTIISFQMATNVHLIHVSMVPAQTLFRITGVTVILDTLERTVTTTLAQPTNI